MQIAKFAIRRVTTILAFKLNVASTISWAITITGTGFNINMDATIDTTTVNFIIKQLIVAAIDISQARQD